MNEHGLSEEDDLMPIRAVESVVFCPRQAWYRFVANDDSLNVFMDRGIERHHSLDEWAPPSEGVAFRHLAVTAPKLGVAGVLDEVEIGEKLTITEYKTSKLARLIWPATLAQLGVQHLALREHATSERWHGPELPAPTVLRVYFADSRRYRSAPWSPAVEATARSALETLRAVVSARVPPTGNVGPRCAHCQLREDCLPFEMDALLGATS